jgi:acetyl-CoA carboxylase biotin carboxyl carrier protein
LELKQIKELMAAMGRAGVMRLMLKKEGFELELEREENGLFKPVDQMLEEENPLRSSIEQHRANMALGKGAADVGSNRMAAKVVASQEEDIESVYVTSPMVGTFYGAPSPEDPPFIKVGDKVEKNTVVGIVEAMKVMNEVKAGVAGTITEILVESGHPVEFGTKLFRMM